MYSRNRVSTIRKRALKKKLLLQCASGARALKKKLCVGALTPEQEHAFKHCSLLSIMVLDPSRHLKQRLAAKRHFPTADVFVFNRGKGNENVFYAAQKSKRGHLWICSPGQLAMLLAFLGSPEALAPAGTNELRALVLQCLQDVQADVDREAQFHMEDNTAKIRAASTKEVSDDFSVVFRPIESIMTRDLSVPIVDAANTGGLGKRTATSASGLQTQVACSPEMAESSAVDKRVRCHVGFAAETRRPTAATPCYPTVCSS